MTKQVLIMSDEAAQALALLQRAWLAEADIDLGGAQNRNGAWEIIGKVTLPPLEPRLSEWLRQYRDTFRVVEVPTPEDVVPRLSAILGPVHDRPEFSIDED